MKRYLSLWLGLLAFALLPTFAQTPTAPTKPMGKIHGHVNGPEGAPRAGTVGLSTDDGRTSKFSFPVYATGDYAGEAAPGTYLLVFHNPNATADQIVDLIEDVKIVVNQDLLQNDDMSRKEFVDKLSSQQKKDLEELKKKNAEAMKGNEVIKSLNADIKTAAQDFLDADSAHAAAVQALGATASNTDIEAKEAEIRTAKYTEIETLMQKDTVLRPAEPTLWAQLAQAQLGLKEYDEAEAAYKKALELDAKKPIPSIEGAINAGLGEVYVRTNKVPEANAAYDAAAKANPAGAATYLTNEATIFLIAGNDDAAAAAADEAIKADPTLPKPYYLKGQSLIGKSTPSPKPNLFIPPPGCAEAYQKYLQLAPNGAYAADVKGIMSSFYVKK